MMHIWDCEAFSSSPRFKRKICVRQVAIHESGQHQQGLQYTGGGAFSTAASDIDNSVATVGAKIVREQPDDAVRHDRSGQRQQIS